jgi:putative transcriptional regulator
MASSRREEVMRDVINILLYADFFVSERCTIRPGCFDLAARRDDSLLLLKILMNLDGARRENIIEMIRLSQYLSACPLMIGKKSGNKSLKRGVVYFRCGIPSINVDTLYDCFIENVPPLIYAGAGGLYVKIDEDRLRDARKNLNLSIGDLASELGVSRRTISKYEGGMNTTLDLAVKMENILSIPLSLSIDIFSLKESLKEEGSDAEDLKEREKKLSLLEQVVIDLLKNVGINVFPINYAPFNALSKIKDELILTGICHLNKTALRRAKLTGSISSVTETQSVFILDEKPSSEKIENTVLVDKEEIGDVKETSEFIELILDKKES